MKKNRIINWVNFINIIKEESSRSIEKLLGNEMITQDLEDKTKKENKD